ncbi:MAG: metallophosphoesterase family protein [Armatimonadetes bacterium]|nr:metallophosphoesterase family protein [Armatimonadota bacterium]
MKHIRRFLFSALLLCAALALHAERIKLGPYLQQVAPGGVTVCWTTDAPVKGVVTYGASGLKEKAAESQPETRHFLRLKGLKPATIYQYRVESGQARNDIHTFRTAPLPGKGFSFVAYGDNRTNNEDHRKVVQSILPLKPDFLVNTGDLVAKGSRPEQWEAFFRTAGPLLARAPLYPSLGNHEGNSSLYFQLFDLPGKKRYYSFDYGNCHIICLDSNSAFMSREEQRRWLVENLSTHQDAAFRIVFFHHPPYSLTTSENRQKYSEAIREQWQKLFEQYRVSLVLNGHDHNYQRAAVNGIQYIVTGGGGAPRYAVGPKQAWNVTSASVLHCVYFQVEGDRIKAQTITPEGKIIDTFEVEAPVKKP